MIARIKKLTQSKFVRSVIIVATGTVGSQAITMLFSPVITRLYGPEAFGLLGTFMAVVAVLTPMAALTYPIAIILPRKNEEAIGLARLSISLAVVISLLTMIVILLWGDELAKYLNANEIAPYLWLVPIAMFFAALHQVIEQWLIRLKQFKVTARVAVIQSVLVNITKVSTGLFYPLGGALIAIQSLSQGVWVFLLWMGAKQRKIQKIRVIDELRTPMSALAYRYRDFAIFRAPEVTINAASNSLPVLMLAAFFGPASAGFYTLGQTVMGIPAGLIGKSVGDVFYPRISEAVNSGEQLYPLVKKATLLMVAVGIMPFSIVIAFGPWLFTFVFGAEWTVAGEYARWLAVWMFFGFANNPSVKAIPVIQAQALHLLWTVITIVLRLGVLFLAYIVFESAIPVVIAFSITGALVNIMLILVVLKKCKSYNVSIR